MFWKGAHYSNRLKTFSPAPKSVRLNTACTLKQGIFYPRGHRFASSHCREPFSPRTLSNLVFAFLIPTRASPLTSQALDHTASKLVLYTTVILIHIIHMRIALPLCAGRVHSLLVESDLGCTLQKLPGEPFGCASREVTVHKPGLRFTRRYTSLHITSHCFGLTPGLLVFMTITTYPLAGKMTTSLRGASTNLNAFVIV